MNESMKGTVSTSARDRIHIPITYLGLHRPHAFFRTLRKPFLCHVKYLRRMKYLFRSHSEVGKGI